MTDIEKIMLVERLRTLQADRETLQRMITEINRQCKEINEAIEFNNITKNK